MQTWKEQMTLDQLSPGQMARVKKLRGKGAIRRRLLDMGLTHGIDIEMIRASPFGDPIEYSLRGYRLSLRKAEAMTVEVET